MKVKVSAVGNIKAFVPEEQEINLTAPVSLHELKVLAGIPKERGVMYSVNGRARKGDNLVADNDEVKFLMVVGAG